MKTTRFLYTNFTAFGAYQSAQPLSSEPSTSLRETLSDTSTSSGSNSANATSVLRRAHTKSRRGCLSCKHRRIKCPENRPCCVQCAKRGLQCEWPDIQIQQERQGRQILRDPSLAMGRPGQLGILPPAPHASFTIQDFRLFNHFIKEAHPYHPVGNDEKWTHEIPGISHNHDYLLHSMLALAASDLSCKPYSTSASTPASIPSSSTSPYSLVSTTSEQAHLGSVALYHRLAAIKSLNAALQVGVSDPESGSAMLATCYVLVFQSSLISDCFPEFMSFIRGCIVVAYQMSVKGLRSIFDMMVADELLKVMGPYLEAPPYIPEELTLGAIASLEVCEGLFEGVEKEFWAALRDIAREALTSARGAYLGIMRIYTLFAHTMTSSQFSVFISPSNPRGLLLQAHLVAIQTILDPVLTAERQVDDDVNSSKHTNRTNWAPGNAGVEGGKRTGAFEQNPKHWGSMRWLDSMHQKVEQLENACNWREYFWWTKQRAAEIRATFE